MRKFVLLLSLLVIATTVYPQEVNFFILTGDKDISKIRKPDFHTCDFILLTGDPHKKFFTKNLKFIRSEISDTLPFFIFPAIPLREFLIENFLSDEEEIVRRFFVKSGSNSIIGINTHLSERPELFGLLPEDKAWVNENLKEIKTGGNYYVLSFSNSANDFTGLKQNSADSLSLKKFFFVPLKKLTGFLSGKSYLKVKIKNDKIFTGKSNKPVLKLTALIKTNNEKKIIKDKSAFSKIIKRESNSFAFSKPVFDGAKFYLANSSGIISCIDTSGKTIWDYDAAATIISDLLLFQNYLIFTTLEGDVIILNKLNGEQLESLGVDDAIVTRPVLFTYKGDKNLLYENSSGNPAAIAFGSASGKIYAYTIPTFEELWINQENKMRPGDEMVSSGNKLVYFNSPGILYNIDLSTGWTIWKWKSGKTLSKLTSNILADNNRLFFQLSNGKLYKLDLLSGKKLFSVKTGIKNGFLSPGLKSNIIITGNGKVKIISSETGKILKSYKLKEQQTSFGNSATDLPGKLLYGVENGNVYELTQRKIKLKFQTDLIPLQYVYRIAENKFMIFDTYNNFENIEIRNE